ncbi:MFS transporter [Merismopedia glauca]|uniref:MFS transporter n=1 Tax=Merismopedia glauca CCAP 1448/3 TaxID=1296344 RepID=A0A2T1C6M7_9CYAN|nr:MFS transporter [Merismopedia glauca]PSB03930.1 MFS transporter [Merismopedia glauca CCAP 1448/3]
MPKIPKSLFAEGLPALYAIAFLAGISIGLFNPFISTFMTEHQVEEVWIGANSTIYFLAIALGTPLIPKVLRQIGLRRTMMLGLILTGLSAPLFPLTNQLSLWFLIRIVMGMGVCLYLVCEQTGLNYFCQESDRALVNGLNALFFSFGFGIGPVMGASIYKYSPNLAFALGGALILSGAVVVWLSLPEKQITFHPLKGNHLVKKLTIPLQGAFAYGFTVATLVSLYPVYLLKQNQSLEQIGYTFSFFVAGSVLATVPVTHLGDKFGRGKILSLIAGVSLFSLLSLSISPYPQLNPLFSFLAGASVSPILPLTLALIGEKLPTSQLSAGSSLLTATYSLGCTAGPLLSSLMMNQFNEQYIFSLAILIFTAFMISLSLIKPAPKIVNC